MEYGCTAPWKSLFTEQPLELGTKWEGSNEGAAGSLPGQSV